MGFFLLPWIVTFVGWVVHAALDRSPQRRTPRRLVELLLVWLLVFGGVWSLFAALGHLGPNATEIAAQIGYAPSMFQWEVGWADVAVGVLGIGCAWRRDGWLTAAVVVLSVSYLGDATGHIKQYLGEANAAPDNLWAIPGDLLGPLLAIALLVAYRRMTPAVATAAATTAPG